MNTQIIRSINPTKEGTRKNSPLEDCLPPNPRKNLLGGNLPVGGNFRRDNFSVTQKGWYYENLSQFLSLKTLLTFYKSFARPNFNSWKKFSLTLSKLK